MNHFGIETFFQHVDANHFCGQGHFRISMRKNDHWNYIALVAIAGSRDIFKYLSEHVLLSGQTLCSYRQINTNHPYDLYISLWTPKNHGKSWEWVAVRCCSIPTGHRSQEARVPLLPRYLSAVAKSVSSWNNLKSKRVDFFGVAHVAPHITKHGTGCFTQISVPRHFCSWPLRGLLPGWWKVDIWWHLKIVGIFDPFQEGVASFLLLQFVPFLKSGPKCITIAFCVAFLGEAFPGLNISRGTQQTMVKMLGFQQ